MRFYCAQNGVPVCLSEEADDASPIQAEENADEDEETLEPLFPATVDDSLTERRNYDIEHYVRVLRDLYAERLHVVFEAEDFQQIFHLDAQRGVFD